MNIITMDGEFWWFVRPDDLRPVRGLSIHQVVKRIQEAFNFASVPTSLPAEGQPFIFKEGMFRQGSSDISIKFLESYNDGVHIKVKSSTEDADVVFNKLRQVSTELGGRSNITPLLTYHISTIVVELDSGISKAVANFSEIVSMISDHLEISATVDLKAIVFGGHPVNSSPLIQKLNPTNFRLERRVDTSFEENRYFSTANMSTSAHVEVVRSLRVPI